MVKFWILNLETNPKKLRQPNPKNEDELTQKRRRPNPKNEDDLIQKNRDLIQKMLLRQTDFVVV